MTIASAAFDPDWEMRYREGYVQRYPWDKVVTFVFRHAPRDRPRREVRILEIGCGSGSNLWFAAREGFSVAGIDGSATAIEAVRRRFREEGLEGDFAVGDFTQPLPFADSTYDLAIDRGSIVCVGFSAARRAVGEVHRKLKPGGLFLFNPYSRTHTSFAAGTPAEDGLVRDVAGGSLVDVGPLCFYSEEMVREILAEGWEILGLSHVELRSSTTGDSPLKPDADVHAEWSAIARKARS